MSCTSPVFCGMQHKAFILKFPSQANAISSNTFSVCLMRRNINTLQIFATFQVALLQTQGKSKTMRVIFYLKKEEKKEWDSKIAWFLIWKKKKEQDSKTTCVISNLKNKKQQQQKQRYSKTTCVISNLKRKKESNSITACVISYLKKRRIKLQNYQCTKIPDRRKEICLDISVSCV